MSRRRPDSRSPGRASISQFWTLTGRALAGLLLSILSGCAEPRTAPRQTVLLLLDAAVAERFSCYGYQRATTPEIDRLAREGVVFESHFAQATHTRASLPSLLYSRYFALPVFPASDRIPLEDPRDLFRTLDPQAISLPRAFARAGIRTAAISAHVWIREGTRFASEFDELHDLTTSTRVDRRYGYPRGERVVTAAIDWISAHRDRDFFLYVHLMDTHFPSFLEGDALDFFGDGDRSVARSFDSNGAPRNPEAGLNEAERRYLDAVYDGDLRYADRQVGRLFDHLRAVGSAATTTIAITADHGEHLVETPGRFGHGGPWLDRVARVPLVLYAPGRMAPGRYSGFSESVDLLPTLLALNGVALPPTLRPDGVDLTRLVSGALEPKSAAVSNQGIRTAEFKLLFGDPPESVLGAEAPEPVSLNGELFDLAADPEELSNLRTERPEVVSDLVDLYRERVLRAHRRYESAVSTEPPDHPFAINTNSFELDRPIAEVSGPRLAATASASSTSDWLRVRHWEQYALFSRRAAQPLRFSVSVPSAVYEVTLAMVGEAEIEIPGSGLVRRVRLASETFEKPVALGAIPVLGGRFWATLTPIGQNRGLEVRYLGFRRVGLVETETDAEREGRLENLRSLGYLR